MAGYIDSSNNGNKPNRLSSFLKKLSSFGMEYGDMVIKNSQSIGALEDKFGYRVDSNNMMGGEYDDYGMFAALAMSDISLRKNIAFFDKPYLQKRDDLRSYAKQDEIEEILDTLCDETIVYDDRNYFCETAPFEDASMADNVLNDVKESLESNFKNIYNYWGFNNDITAWQIFRMFLIDGYLAFEIIYSDDHQKIIGFKNIDATSLMPKIKDGKRMWVQYKDIPTKERTLFDSQVIYISYTHAEVSARVSYVEKLIRSFNLLRLMEHSRIVWAVVNASFKTKFIIPVGGKSKNRQKQSLAILMQNYREVIDFSTDSGELKVNGKPMMPFNKEYWLPETDGGTPQIETIGGDGADLSDTESLQYFRNKLIRVSKIPMSRFDADNSSSWSIGADGMSREEIKFGRFVNRLRSVFQEILVKPLWLQMAIDFPELAEDDSFKSAISISYKKMNYFEEMQEMELLQKRLDFVQSMKDGLVDNDADGNEIKYFSSEFLIRRYMKLSADDIKLNNKLKNKEMKKLADQMPNNENSDLQDDYDLIVEYLKENKNKKPNR